jgi:hypothetical protein
MTAFNSWTGVDSPTLDARYVKVADVVDGVVDATDPTVAALVADADSDTTAALNARYVPAFVVDAATYGDGVTDATAHIQAKIDAAEVAGGDVLFPDGTYAITALTVAASNVRLVGQGGATLESTSTVAAVTLDGTGVIENIAVIDLNFVGTYANDEQKGINIVDVHGLVVQGCSFADFGDTAIFSAAGGEAKNVIVTGNRVTHCGNFGICFNSTTPGEASDITVSNNVLDGFESVLYPAHAIYFKGAHNGVMSANTIRNCTGTGATGIQVSVDCTNIAVGDNVITDCLGGINLFERVTGVSVAGNMIDGLTEGHGVFVSAECVDVSIVGNVITNGTGASRGVYVANVSTERPSRVQVTGNTIYQCASGGFYVSGADQVAFTGNTCILVSNTTAYVVDVNIATDVLIDGNHLVGGNRVVMGRGASTGLTVTNNRCGDSSTYGIRIDSAVTAVVVAGNDLRLSTTPAAAAVCDIASAAYVDAGNIRPTNRYTLAGTAGVQIGLSGQSVGFFGGTPAAKPTVTGSRGSNAALASLLTALAGLGLLTDSSS